VEGEIGESRRERVRKSAMEKQRPTETTIGEGRSTALQAQRTHKINTRLARPFSPIASDNVEAELAAYKKAIADLNAKRGMAADGGGAGEVSAASLVAAVDSLPELAVRRERQGMASPWSCESGCNRQLAGIYRYLCAVSWSLMLLFEAGIVRSLREETAHW
jgi:hypothetical protein